MLKVENMLDTREIENDNLEEALERIIILADSIGENAPSAVENSTGNPLGKKRKGVGKLKSSADAFVLGSGCKSLRSYAEKSIQMQIQPRLSPLAARAALAAAVTPLEHASQSCLSNKPNMQPTFRASISPPKICENGSRKHGKSTRVSARRNHGSVTSGQTFATSVEQVNWKASTLNY